jgi:transcriptional regulator with XRE-family HTH domain
MYTIVVKKALTGHAARPSITNVSTDQIGRIERGVTTSPQMRTVRGLVEALGVAPSELLRD